MPSFYPARRTTGFLQLTGLCLLLSLLGCGGGSGGGGVGGAGGGAPEAGSTTFAAAWPANLDAVLTSLLPDNTGDQVLLPVSMAGTPYSAIVPFPSVDVRQVRLGVDQGFLYIRVDFAGVIPTAPVLIPAAGQVELQEVRNQGMNISINSDDNQTTGGNGEGVNGIEIFFAVGFDYGLRTNVYANGNFLNGDLHQQQLHVLGEIGSGGPGTDFAIVRFDISALGAALVPVGQEVELGSWSEAESFDIGGGLKYHHFAFDPYPGTIWRIRDSATTPVPVPGNLVPILADTYADPAGDFEALSQAAGGPGYPAPVTLAGADLSQVSLGEDNGFLYVRFDYDAAIPVGQVAIPAAGPIEAQIASHHRSVVALDGDENPATGSVGGGQTGSDILFQVEFTLGGATTVAARFDLATGNDPLSPALEVPGELIGGGPGQAFAVVRFPLDGVPRETAYRRGVICDLAAWTEVQSAELDGVTPKYLRLTFDRLALQRWQIPVRN